MAMKDIKRFLVNKVLENLLGCKNELGSCLKCSKKMNTYRGRSIE